MIQTEIQDVNNTVKGEKKKRKKREERKEERNVRNSNPVAYGTGDEEIVGQRVAARSNGHKKGGAPKVVNDSGGVPFVVVGRSSKRQR